MHPHTQHGNIIHKSFALQAQSSLKAKSLSLPELKKINNNLEEASHTLNYYQTVFIV
jgi:hypothetical protein